MDGFDTDTNIVIVAPPTGPTFSTRRYCVPAADRKVVVDRPDRLPQRTILKVHAAVNPSRPTST
ncbi:MAG: hypothetical protein H6643_00770 [Caldilineaceae bacterium]|nr:hypothetical protein [Caldilineaceae bacterium]